MIFLSGGHLCVIRIFSLALVSAKPEFKILFDSCFMQEVIHVHAKFCWAFLNAILEWVICSILSSNSYAWHHTYCIHLKVSCLRSLQIVKVTSRCVHQKCLILCLWPLWVWCHACCVQLKESYHLFSCRCDVMYTGANNALNFVLWLLWMWRPKSTLPHAFWKLWVMSRRCAQEKMSNLPCYSLLIVA